MLETRRPAPGWWSKCLCDFSFPLFGPPIQEPPKTTENFRKPPKTSENPRKPLKTSETPRKPSRGPKKAALASTGPPPHHWQGCRGRSGRARAETLVYSRSQPLFNGDAFRTLGPLLGQKRLRSSRVHAVQRAGKAALGQNGPGARKQPPETENIEKPPVAFFGVAWI